MSAFPTSHHWPADANSAQGKPRWKRGDVDPDGRVFVGYAKSCKGGEWWVSRDKFDAMCDRHEARSAGYAASHASGLRKWKRGDIDAETGLIFWAYRKDSKTAEKWMTAQAFAVRVCKAKIAGKRSKANPENRARARAKDKTEGRLEYRRAWTKRPEQAAKRRAIRNARLKNDPVFKAANLTRIRICTSLRRIGAKKSKHTAKIIGCSWSFLRSYLEARFSPGMTWVNHGLVWHIDHVIPIATAKSAREVYQLCHYTNLRPLFALENLRKGDSVPTQIELSLT